MKLLIPYATSFFVSATAVAGKTMLRNKGKNGRGTAVLHDRKLTHQGDISSGTPVADLCDYYPEHGRFDPLPVSVTNGEPDKVFKIENAAGITLTFSTSGTTEEDTVISIWDAFEKGDGNHLLHKDDGFNGDLQTTLAWAVPNDSVYYVRFGSFCSESYSANATWITDKDWLTCLPPSDAPSNAPSSEPSNRPTSKPSSSPSSQPSRLTCEMVNPCDYDMENDGMGGFNIIETYYPVCIHQEKTKKSKAKSYFHQECYPESIISGFGAGDVDPGHDDRMIVNCGCCPSSDDMLPEDVEKVKGSTDVCDGGLDCLAEGASVSSNKSGRNDKPGTKGKLGKKAYFQMCIDGDDDHWEELFYLPKDDETASCGKCGGGDIVV